MAHPQRAQFLGQGRCERRKTYGRLFDHAEPQVRDTGRVNDPEGLQFDVVGCEMVEQANTATEQHGHEVDLYLVQQASPKALLRNTGAHQGHVFSPSNCFCLPDGARYTIRDESVATFSFRYIFGNMVRYNE